MTKITSLKVGRKLHGGTGIFGYNATITYDHGNGVTETHKTTFVSTMYADPEITVPWVSVGEVFIDHDVRVRCGGKLTPKFIHRFYGVEA